MSPEARRQAIVEAAVDLVLNLGHSGFNLEQVAEHAGISKPLIYKYFARRQALLKAMLDHEIGAMNGSGLSEIPDEVPIERIIRSTVKRALTYYHERGPVLRMIITDPDMRTPGRRRGQKKPDVATTDYFVKKLTAEYKVSKDVALIAVTMVVNAPILSMQVLRKQEIDIDRTIDVWSEFIMGGWLALRKKYGDLNE